MESKKLDKFAIATALQEIAALMELKGGKYRFKAKAYNAQRYHYAGIGRYEADAAIARGLADLRVLARLIPTNGFVHGDKPTSIDAGIYGFIANIHFYDIDTPLKQFVAAHDNIVRHCRAIHDAVSR